MVKALAGLRPFPDCLLVDGDQIIPGEFLGEKISIACRPLQRTVVKGDQTCLSIAAASILAKVVRDDVMIELDTKYPQYGFAQHKGYTSVEHLEALRRHGPCTAHRRSFKPVRDVCPGIATASLPLWTAAESDE
jgi:ribonuclease HII